MFLPKQLLELESLLPTPLPSVLRRYLARRPQGNAFPGWQGHPRALVLAHYRERLARGADPMLLPIGRGQEGEWFVHISDELLWREDAGRTIRLAEAFGPWLAQQRGEKKTANEQPLHRAARAGDRKRLQRLLQRGANLDSPDAEGRTALMAALLAWQYEAAALLLDAGADLSLRDREGHAALMWAAWRNQPALVRRMLERGADPHARTRSGEGILYFALTGPRSVTEGGGKGSREVVEILLEAGVGLDEPQLPGGKRILELDPGETDAGLWAWLLTRATTHPPGLLP